MNIRVSKNAGHVRQVEDALSRLVVTQEEMEGCSREAEQFYLCALSYCSITDILTDPVDNADCIGFGLAVRRTEVVLDEPTAVSQ